MLARIRLHHSYFLPVIVLALIPFAVFLFRHEYNNASDGSVVLSALLGFGVIIITHRACLNHDADLYFISVLEQARANGASVVPRDTIQRFASTRFDEEAVDHSLNRLVRCRLVHRKSIDTGPAFQLLD